ncbi:MAG: VWA domain-containing protein [Lachnospiraceae bacterium]|nr:VWA domain-containing protein [Lachnospiraceae bacterium]
MKKKLICALLSLAMIGTMLTGCGSETSESTSTRKSISATSQKEKGNDRVKEATNDVARPERVKETEEYEEEAYMTTEATADCEYPVYDEQNFNQFNAEEYSSVNENGFSKTQISPLSTFAADVDTASYSNFRRFVTQGYGIEDFPSGAIRTEEMVNYFKYNYKDPGKNIFGVTAEISDCPWNEEAKLMMLGVNTAEMDSKNVPDSNIVFLVDVSGSMKDANKLPLIKNSMELLLDSFDEDDRISIVTYAGGVDVVLDGARGDERREIMKAFSNLRASGSTNGADGIVLAYDVAKKHFIEDGVNRVIICTDGDFNVGLSSEAELEDLISEKKETGVFLSVLGFGMYNYSDTRMETLADKGNGNYAYIDTLSEAKKVLVDEMTSTFVTVAKDVKLQVEFNPALVKEYRLVGYENRAMAAEDFTDDKKDGGEMGAGHQVTAIYEIILNDDENEALSDLKYQDITVSKKGKNKDEYCTLKIAYKDPDGDKSNYLEFPIDMDNYTKRPSDDYIFATSVAEMSLALRHSEYLKDLSPTNALHEIAYTLEDLDDLDTYQNEFLDLVNEVISQSRGR